MEFERGTTRPDLSRNEARPGPTRSDQWAVFLAPAAGEIEALAWVDILAMLPVSTQRRSPSCLRNATSTRRQSHGSEIMRKHGEGTSLTDLLARNADRGHHEMIDATTTRRHRKRSTVRGREYYIDSSTAEIFEEQISEQIRRWEAMLGDDRSETPPIPPRHVVTPIRRARARRSHRVVRAVIKTAAGDSGDGDPELDLK